MRNITLTDAEMLWLSECNELFERGEEREPREIKAALHAKLPPGFDHDSLRAKGLCNGTEITLLGILQINPDSKYLEFCSQFIEAVRSIIVTQHNTKKIDSAAIIRKTELPTPILYRTVRLLSGLGEFSSGYSYKEGHLQSISVDRDDVFDEYLAYKSMDMLLENYIEKIGKKQSSRSVQEARYLSRETDNTDHLPSVNEIWVEIHRTHNISKLKFAKRINFIRDSYRRKTILRDVAHAYYLAHHGFHKSAVILAGSVIEELLRQFLISKDILGDKKSFISYIKTCKDHGILKSGINSLNDYVREFRNQVHMRKEVSPKDQIKDTHALGAVLSIFILIEDFD